MYNEVGGFVIISTSPSLLKEHDEGGCDTTKRDNCFASRAAETSAHR